MAKPGQGKGWHNDRKEHSEASKKGWAGRTKRPTSTPPRDVRNQAQGGYSDNEMKPYVERYKKLHADGWDYDAPSKRFSNQKDADRWAKSYTESDKSGYEYMGLQVNPQTWVMARRKKASDQWVRVV